MIVRSKNFELKLEEITKEKVIDVTKNSTEQKVLELIDQWRTGKQTFEFQTSGSTGLPKHIAIDRAKIAYSTHATFDFIDASNLIKNTLLCINPAFIGGAMVIFRALIKKLDLFITEPGSNPMEELPPSQHFDLVSMVPLQYESMNPKDLRRFKVVLIGGAPYTGALATPQSTTVYSSYGMTETVSHVALRKLDEPFFSLTGDAEVGLDTNKCLKFKGAITDYKWLITSDLGEILSTKKFKWIARKDFIINSGGMKINPETVENKLSSQLNEPFHIIGIPDDRLGEKVALVIEGKARKIELNYDTLSKYEKPREIFFWEELPKTASGKIDRATVKKILSKS